MTGSVIAISRGMVIARTSQGDYSVFELSGGHDAEVRDEISGNLHEEGPGVIKNITQGESMDVIIQGVHGTKSDAIASIRWPH
jgi:hypothetical protein